MGGIGLLSLILYIAERINIFDEKFNSLNRPYTYCTLVHLLSLVWGFVKITNAEPDHFPCRSRIIFPCRNWGRINMMRHCNTCLNKVYWFVYTMLWTSLAALRKLSAPRLIKAKFSLFKIDTGFLARKLKVVLTCYSCYRYRSVTREKKKHFNKIFL
jgi:predicted ferric reductase